MTTPQDSSTSSLQDTIKALVAKYEAQCGFFLELPDVSEKAMGKVVELLDNLREQRACSGELRKAYVCANCHAVYADEPVSICDCSNHETQWIEGEIRYPTITHPQVPIDMVLFCPKCDTQHIDEQTSEWANPPHKSHLCCKCGHLWRPSDHPTNGVAVTASGKDNDLSPAQPQITRERWITALICSAYPQILDKGVPEKMADAIITELESKN